ncbi:MAG: hypothetical protein JSV91_14485 [Phycisphaerales bacterium]|nr:MAG: hypothetical protein JSV91_14485 [Phycisphaerales bacterium]
MKIRQGTYLNAILTVNAVLLSALVWTQLAPRPVMAETATAQATRRPGIPNAAEQRQKLITAVKDMKASVDSTRKLLESGKLKVEVTNLDEIRLEADRGR